MYESIKRDETLLKYFRADADPERITKMCSDLLRKIDACFFIDKCMSVDSLDFDLSYRDCFVKPGISKDLDQTYIANEDGCGILEAIRLFCNDLIAMERKRVTKKGAIKKKNL
jgi:hypothetical protein